MKQHTNEEIIKMSDEDFIKNCKSAAYQVLTAWCDGVSCYKTGGNKQFCLTSSHNFGTAQCSWADKRLELFRALERVGAIRISGKVKWDYVRIEFDRRKRL